MTVVVTMCGQKFTLTEPNKLMQTQLRLLSKVVAKSLILPYQQLLCTNSTLFLLLC